MSKRVTSRPIDFKRGRVEMIHGSGGKATAQLVDELFLKSFDNPWLAKLDDQARFQMPGGAVVMATDSHVVTPLFFPGGDIGSLAFNGTVNDLAMAGARPLYLSAAFIVEEGFSLAELKRIVESMAEASARASVPVVTGDTKVVEKGKGDGVFITTSGVGVVPPGVQPGADGARPGDRILVSGPIGDHGVAVMSLRENLSFGTAIESDSAALHDLVARMVERVPGVHCLRDPTRGGLGSALNEIAASSAVGMQLEESSIPVRPGVRAACELLGLDPLYVACEGRLLAICDPGDAEALLTAMRSHALGAEAADIGEVVEDPHHFVEMRTAFGGRRMVDWLSGEQLPRIC